jgi:hypothetical protein
MPSQLDAISSRFTRSQELLDSMERRVNYDRDRLIAMQKSFEPHEGFVQELHGLGPRLQLIKELEEKTIAVSKEIQKYTRELAEVEQEVADHHG